MSRRRGKAGNNKEQGGDKGKYVYYKMNSITMLFYIIFADSIERS